MQIVYILIIKLYSIAIWFSQFFNRKAKLWIQGRKNIWDKIKQVSYVKDKKIVWMHVSSLGEFEQGRPIIEEIKTKYQNICIVLTFFSPSGYEIRKNYNSADFIIYLPIDSNKNAKLFYDLVKPNLVIFVKYDFWYFYIREASFRSIPIVLISAIFKENNIFFKWYGTFFRNMLHFFTLIFVQDKHSKNLTEKIGLNTIVAGDTRCDRVLKITQATKNLDQIKQYIKNRIVVVVGSAWKKDIKIISSIINTFNNILWIVAPHNIEAENINSMLKLIQKPCVKYSQLNNHIEDIQILIIDNIGMLSSLYSIAHIAYIGGGFGKGIHNILEPAAFGIPIIFGPKYHKFNEAIDLIEKGAAFTIQSSKDAQNVFAQLLTDETLRNNYGNIAKKYIEEKAGASNLIMNYLHKFLQ